MFKLVRLNKCTWLMNWYLTTMFEFKLVRMGTALIYKFYNYSHKLYIFIYVQKKTI